jgi:hypothetical protein
MTICWPKADEQCGDVAGDTVGLWAQAQIADARNARLAPVRGGAGTGGPAKRVIYLAAIQAR